MAEYKSSNANALVHSRPILSALFISTLVEKQHGFDGPTLQVLKILATDDDDFKIHLSDGLEEAEVRALRRKFKKLIQNGELQNNTVVQIIDWSVDADGIWLNSVKFICHQKEPLTIVKNLFAFLGVSDVKVNTTDIQPIFKFVSMRMVEMDKSRYYDCQMAVENLRKHFLWTPSTKVSSIHSVNTL